MTRFLFALQIVFAILWFVPPVAAAVPGFVFFLPIVIWLGLFVVAAFVLAVVMVAQVASSKRRIWR